MKRAPHVTSCIRGNLGTREPLDAWRRESSLSSAETEPRFWTATRTSRGGTGIMYSRCRQFTLVLYDNEACSLSKVPQSVTFVLIKYFIFRYEVAHVVWVSSNGWRKNQSSDAVFEMNWCAVAATLETWYLETVRTMIRVFVCERIFPFGNHQLIEVHDDRSAACQKMVPSFRKWSNGHPWWFWWWWWWWWPRRRWWWWWSYWSACLMCC